MEYPRTPSLNYYHQGKSMEDLRYCLLYTSLELETTRLTAEEEIKKREDQIIHLREVLNRTIAERDEANAKCQRYLMDRLMLLQQLHQTTATPNYNSGASSIDEEPVVARRQGDNSNSDCEESIVSSPLLLDPIAHLVPADKPLPQKGKLLQAVMKAGPLLQTLLLAGPLPQWRHPPPPLESFEIPPVTCGTDLNNNKKRGLMAVYEGSDSSTESKYQRV